MERVEADGDWSLFCPNEAKGLADVWGADFKTKYEGYEKAGKARKTIKAQALWFAILDSQCETGTPYMLFKDACNSKSNQQNLGTIKCSNLCTEIVQYTSPDEVAVCNLASINLKACLTTAPSSPRGTPDPHAARTYDFQRLYEVTKVVTKNLNRVIDENYYPVPEAEYSNTKHRPIGIGVQGLADALILMRLPFESEGAKRLNKDIFETIYFAAVEASCELAAKDGHYESYPGSPASEGKLQFDLWGVTPDSGRWDWAGLKAKMAVHGLRNSLLLAPMPTASTAQILGNNESIEPFTSNMYSRRVLAGEFTIVNKYLMKDLINLGIWNADVKNQIVADRGSVQNVRGMPQDLKDLYKTVWEIKQKALLDMSADRGAYICQSQSMNVHMADPTPGRLTSMHFYSWKKGLKTGMYYLRTRPKADAIQFTVDQSQLSATRAGNAANKGGAVAAPAPVEEDEDICLSCGA